MDTKLCAKCGERKPLGDFGTDKRNKDGHRGRCKPCTREDDRLYSQTPRAKKLAAKRTAEWTKRNPEWSKEVQRRCYATNRAKRLAEMAAYRAANREAMHERERKWREANRARKTEHERKRLALKRAAYVAEVVLDEIIQRDLGVCGICGLPVMGDLELDHVTPLAAGGVHSPENIQLSHTACNRRKGARTDFDLRQAA